MKKTLKKARETAPSTPKKKKIKAFEPPKVKKAKSPVKVGAPKLSDKDKEVSRKIAANSKKQAGKSPLKTKHKPDPKLVELAAKNYLEYMRKRARAFFGTYTLEADGQGKDGEQSLRLLEYASKQLKLKIPRVIDKFLAGDETVTEFLMSCASYNAWLWNNFAWRLWDESRNMEPPMHRIVGIRLSELFPGAAFEGVLDRYATLAKNEGSMKQALNGLGAATYRARILPTLDIDCKPSTLQRLHGLFGLPHQRFWFGFIVPVTAESDYSHYPRDCVFIQPLGLRKSSHVKRFLHDAIDQGYKVILDHETLKGTATTTAEIKVSENFLLLKRTWGNLQPLITMPISSKMKRVSNMSKITDILLV